MSKLIDNLLFLARSDHKKLLLTRERFHAQEEIQQLFDFYQIVADEKQINLSCMGQAELFVDRNLFKRVMNNLLSNALRYTPPQGSVSVDLQTLDTGTCIRIQDSGKGIAEEHLPKIFDRCYRVEPDRNSDQGGLGLGLAIVKSIVDLHEGRISVSSQVNQGTCVSLFL